MGDKTTWSPAPACGQLGHDQATILRRELIGLIAVLGNSRGWPLHTCPPSNELTLYLGLVCFVVRFPNCIVYTTKVEVGDPLVCLFDTLEVCLHSCSSAFSIHPMSRSNPSFCKNHQGILIFQDSRSRCVVHAALSSIYFYVNGVPQ